MNMRKFLNIAHRGFSAKYPENTLVAFREGIRAGADGFECDLRLTADGVVVIFHDNNLKRLCGISGRIENLPYSEVRKLKVKGKESIPTLEEVLKEFLTTRINLEIKPSNRDTVVVESVLRVMTKVRPEGEIFFSSFSHEVLECLQVMDAKKKLGKTGLLVETRDLSSLPDLNKRLKPDTWNVPRQILTKPWANRWKDVKVPPLHVWTLDEPDLWTQVLKSELPFEAIISNRPDALSQFLKTSGHPLK